MSEDNHDAMIPYFVHESDMARMERVNKRLWIIILTLIIALIGTNIAWCIYESQFEDSVITTEIDAQQEGDYNFLSGRDLNYGPESTHQADD